VRPEPREANRSGGGVADLVRDADAQPSAADADRAEVAQAMYPTSTSSTVPVT
jgi:hypothetical protein